MKEQFNESLKQLEPMLMEAPMLKEPKAIYHRVGKEQKSFDEATASTKTKPQQLQEPEKKSTAPGQSILSMAVVPILFGTAICLSIKSNYLFFGELMTAGGIISLLLILKFSSNGNRPPANFSNHTNSRLN